MINLILAAILLIIVVVYIISTLWCCSQITARKGRLNRPLYLKVEFIPFYAIYYWNFVLKKEN
jgi:hypothetical protein